MYKNDFKPNWNFKDNERPIWRNLTDDSKKIQIWNGKDSEERRCVIIRLKGNHKNNFKKIEYKVFDIDYTNDFQENPEMTNIYMSLKNITHQDDFDDLIVGIAKALDKVEKSDLAMRITMSRLKRWSDFWEKTKQEKNKIVGLYGELIYLKQNIQRLKTDEINIIGSWAGPEGNHHDFVYENFAVEIKSLSTNDKDKINISSEYQLDGKNIKLFLKIFFLNRVTDTKTPNLNDIVNSIYESLVTDSAKDLFSEKLEQAGYINQEVNDDYRFDLAQEKNFLVSESFPKLTRKNIPSSISKLSYQLDITHLDDFICDDVDIFK